MDLCDMVESLRKHQQAERAKPGFYDGCTKIDWELEELCLELDRNATVRVMSPEESSKYMRTMTRRHYHTPTKSGDGLRPRIQEFVDIARSMTQGSGGIVSLC
jgi:hypothetical protein